jgi:hypothetical protein
VWGGGGQAVGADEVLLLLLQASNNGVFHGRFGSAPAVDVRAEHQVSQLCHDASAETLEQYELPYHAKEVLRLKSRRCC